MSKIDEMIWEMCPEGVEYRRLGEVTQSINIGINPRKFFKLNPPDADCFYVTVRELNGLDGVRQLNDTDLISSDAKCLINSRANIEPGDVLFSNTGTVGKLALVPNGSNNWAVNEGIYVIKPREMICSRFLYYLLDSGEFSQQCEKNITGAMLRHITQQALKNISVPVPPLPIQQEIVRILDSFTDYTSELQAELQARKKQYEYYRDSLLDFENGLGKEIWGGAVNTSSLGAIAQISIGDFVRKDRQSDEYKYPVWNGGITPTGKYSDFNHDGDKIIISARGANAGFVNKFSGRFFRERLHNYEI